MSVEGTYDTDLTDRRLMEGLVTRQAGNVAERLRKPDCRAAPSPSRSGCTTSRPCRRSTTLAAPTDAAPTIARLARGLLAELDTTGGVRLLGVGVSGLADWIQEDLFGETRTSRAERARAGSCPTSRTPATWAPGMDVVHDELGAGWVWGAGRGIVTVRFETAETAAGPVRSLPADDPALSAWRPGVKRTRSPGRSCAHCHRSCSSTTATTG